MASMICECGRTVKQAGIVAHQKGLKCLEARGLADKKIRGSVYDDGNGHKWILQHYTGGIQREISRKYTAENKEDVYKNILEIQKKLCGLVNTVELKEPEITGFRGGFIIKRYEWANDEKIKQIKKHTKISKKTKETLEECKTRAMLML